MTEPPPRKKLPMMRIGAVVLVAVVLLVLLVAGGDTRGMVALARDALDRGMAALRAAGPAPFFLAMAVAPMAGMPMMAFSLTAGPAFSDQLGMGQVVFWSLVATAANFSLSYVLARRALRPVLDALVRRLGYKLPVAESGDVTDLIVIVRVTPGIPFFVQNYLLGLAEAPAGRYLLISSVIALPYAAGFVLFGDALLEGEGKVVILSIGLIVAVVAAMHLLRRHFGRKGKQS